MASSKISRKISPENNSHTPSNTGRIQGNELDQCSARTPPATTTSTAKPRGFTHPAAKLNTERRTRTFGESLFNLDHSENPNYAQNQLYESSTLEKNSQRLACASIFMAAFLESCAINTVAYALLPIANNDPYGWTVTHSANILTTIYLVKYFTSFITAVLSDTYIEHFITIIIGYVIFTIGYVIYMISQTMEDDTCSTDNFYDTDSVFDKACGPLVITALIITAMGSGVISGNMIIFGADQSDKQSSIPCYFHLYYWFEKLGAAVSCFLINYLEAMKFGSHELGTYTAFGCLCLSFVFFMLGKNFYVYRKKQPDMAPCVCRILNMVASGDNRKKYVDYLGQSKSSNLHF